MENFRIDFTLSDPFPDGKKLGECGEKNAAQLIITPPANLASRDEIRSYVVAFSTGRGPVRYGPVPKAETITVPVGNALTVGSALSVQLEGYDSDGEFIIKSPVLSGIMLSGSIADGDCSDGNNSDSIIPGHIHNNYDVLEQLSDYNGTLRYKGEDVIFSESTETVEVVLAQGSFAVTTGFPFVGCMRFVVFNDENGNPYVPEGAEIVSVELNIAPAASPEWIDIRNMFETEPHTPYFINQNRAFFTTDEGGTVVAAVTFTNETVNSYYEAADNYLVNGLRIKYVEKGGTE